MNYPAHPMEVAYFKVAALMTRIKMGATGRADMLQPKKVLQTIAEARAGLDALEAECNVELDRIAAQKLADLENERRLSGRLPVLVSSRPNPEVVDGLVTIARSMRA